MAIRYKKIWVFVAIFGIMGSVYAQQKVTKKLEKTYSFTNSGALNIENKYGDIKVYGWEKEELVITMGITVENKKKEEAKEMLKRIKPVLRNSENYVSVTYEVLEKETGFFNQLFEKANPFDMDKSTIKIDFKVYLPTKSELDISNKFGDVFLESWKGVLKAKVEHGDMWLNNDLNKADLSMQYGEIKARNINYGNFELTNGSLDMEDSKSLHINSNGSEIDVQKITSMELHSNKDEVVISEVGSLYGTLKFTNLQLTRLSTYADLNMRVADLRVDEVIAPETQINVNQESSEVNINVNNFSHSFNAVLEEGLVRLPKSFEKVSSKMLDKGKKLREISASYGSNIQGEINITGKKGLVLIKEF